MSNPTDTSMDQLLAVFQTPAFAEALERAVQRSAQKNGDHFDPDASYRQLPSLLIEYTKKLATVSLAESNPVDRDYFAKIQPPARQLAQFVSQRLGHIRDEVLRLELQLRLAEFESALAMVMTSPHLRKIRQ